MSKKESRVAKNCATRNKARRTIWLVIAISITSLCAVGVVAPWKPTNSKSYALLAPVQSPTPLPLSKEYIYAGGKLIAVESGNAAPTISITNPTNNSVSTANSNLSISVNASDTDGTISQVQIYQGTTLLGAATAAGIGVYNYTWNNVPVGTYALTAKATDNLSAVATSPTVNVIINSPPNVVITTPANNYAFAAGSNLPIIINASDSDGTVSQVQVFQGATLLGSATSSGGGVYNYTWTSVPSGSYALTANATDNRNTVTTSPVINVNATAPGSNSLSLNGTSAYADVANSTSLNITGSVTVEAWVKINAVDGNPHDVVSRINRNEAGSGGGYALSVNGVGKARLDLFQSHNQYTTVIGTTVLSTGVWHHLAGVFDGSQMRVYVNGVLDGSLSTTSGPTSGTSLLRIGKAAHASNAPPLYLPPYYFAGLIDEVRVTASAVYSSNFAPATSSSSVSGTRGLWKFDNQSPSDSSGNNNNGSLQGGAGYSTSVPTPPPLNSLSLNGTSAYAEVANSTSLNIMGSITVEAWIKVNAIDGSPHDIVSRINRNEAGSGGGYALSVNGVGKARLDLFQSHNQYTTVIGTTVLSTGVWHHVAGVFDGSQMRMYINGVLDGSLSTTNGPVSGTSLLRIGRAAHASNAPPLYLPPYYFAGLIDEVRVTASAVYSSNFTPATSSGSVSGTRGLWKFDNQSLADASGNNNVGLLQGGATYSTSVP